LQSAIALAQLLPCSDKRLCVKAATASHWHTTQATAAGDGGTLEPTAPRYFQAVASLGRRGWRRRGLWRSADRCTRWAWRW